MYFVARSLSCWFQIRRLYFDPGFTIKQNKQIKTNHAETIFINVGFNILELLGKLPLHYSIIFIYASYATLSRIGYFKSSSNEIKTNNYKLLIKDTEITQKLHNYHSSI